MVTKPATKKTTSKKPVSSKTTSKAPVAKPAATENNLQKVIDLQAKQILKMEKMIQSLDAELKEIKKLVMSEGKPALASVASKAKAPVKTAVMSSKAVSAGSDKKTSAPAKKTATAAKKPASKAGSKSALEDIIEIPKEIADRINALTQAKKVTQTQLGKETDLSQKKIHEIASRKVRDLNKDIIARLTTVIKKYEAK
jgi:hypothetical protein